MWAIVILLFILTIFAFKKTEYFGNNNSNTTKFPKTIWTYWNSNNYPQLIQKCFDSWKYHNPSWTINILDDENISVFLPEYDFNTFKHTDSPARKSDFIRLAILSKFGGVWCDASILMTSSLDWIVESQKDFVGFYNHGFTTNSESPVIESWFIASTHNSPFINSWKNKFFELQNHETVNSFVQEILSDTNPQNIPNDLIQYLAIHLAAQYVLQHSVPLNDTFHIIKAEDGPFKYLAQNDWNSEKSLIQLCNDTSLHTPLIKFRGTDRKTISESQNSACVLNTNFSRV